MRSGGNNLNYFPDNNLTTLASLAQFKRMLMSSLPTPPVYATASLATWGNQIIRRFDSLKVIRFFPTGWLK